LRETVKHGKDSLSLDARSPPVVRTLNPEGISQGERHTDLAKVFASLRRKDLTAWSAAERVNAVE